MTAKTVASVIGIACVLLGCRPPSSHALVGTWHGTKQGQVQVWMKLKPDDSIEIAEVEPDNAQIVYKGVYWLHGTNLQITLNHTDVYGANGMMKQVLLMLAKIREGITTHWKAAQSDKDHLACDDGYYTVNYVRYH